MSKLLPRTLTLRLSREDDENIRLAAELEGIRITRLVRDAAVSHAKRLLRQRQKQKPPNGLDSISENPESRA